MGKRSTRTRKLAFIDTVHTAITEYGGLRTRRLYDLLSELQSFNVERGTEYHVT